ncbi:TPA: phage tail protein, partial [Escherichia coli]
MAIKGLEQAVENLSRISKTAVPGAAAMAITWSEWKRDVSTERVEEGKETTYVYSTYSSGAPRLQVSKSGLWGCHNGTGWLPLAVGQGGTGATTVEDARNNLSLGESSAVKFKNLTLTEALD